MGVVLVLAVGFAALRGADGYWAGGFLLLTQFLLCVALIGALCGDERRRAGRLGFAILGGAYFALVFHGLPDGHLTMLPTSRLLYAVHDAVAEPTPLLLASPGYAPLQIMPGDGIATLSWVPASPAGPATTLAAVNPAGANRWRLIFPGASDYIPFGIVGHCLFALLAGVLGAFIARRYQARRVRD